jgi:hypothetical protein
MKDEQHPILDTLIVGGILYVIGRGAYEILKNIGSYKAGQRISEEEAIKLAGNFGTLPDTGRQVREVKRIVLFCDKCQKETEQCQSRLYHTHSPNRCIPCNGGIGDKRNRWCEICDQDCYDNMDD